MGINRGTVLDLINDVHRAGGFKDYNSYSYLFNQVDTMPESVEKPEPHEIGYDDCSNALLKMWMDNVLTDGEYYRIADKLNEKWGKTELPEPYKGVTE